MVLFIFEVDQSAGAWSLRLCSEVVFLLFVGDRVVAEDVGVVLVLDRDLCFAGESAATLSRR